MMSASGPEQPRRSQVCKVEIVVGRNQASARRQDGQCFAHYFLAAVVLNTAVAVRFGLTDDFKPDAFHLEGFYDDQPIDLTIWAYHDPEDTFGLLDNAGFYTPQQDEVLAWYGELLRALLQQRVEHCDCDYGCGAWLELDESDPASRAELVDILMATLNAYTGQPSFANAVFHRVAWETYAGCGLHLAQLTGEEIDEVFGLPAFGVVR
jgi:hypothetical protein